VSNKQLKMDIKDLNYRADFCLYSVSNVYTLVDEKGRLKPYSPAFPNYYSQMADPATLQEFIYKERNIDIEALNCVMIFQKDGTASHPKCLWKSDKCPENLESEIASNFNESMIVFSSWNYAEFDMDLEHTIRYDMQVFCHTPGMGLEWSDKKICRGPLYRYLYIRDSVNDA